MEVTFHEVRKIKINALKHQSRAGATWLQINVCDKGGEHIINCFPENDETIPICLHQKGDDDD